MDAYEIVGLVAASLTTASFVPQVLHTLRTRSAADISLMWIVMFTTGITLWLIYGLSLSSLPIIAGNAITLVLLSVIAWVKFSPGRSVKEMA